MAAQLAARGIGAYLRYSGVGARAAGYGRLAARQARGWKTAKRVGLSALGAAATLVGMKRAAAYAGGRSAKRSRGVKKSTGRYRRLRIRRPTRSRRTGRKLVSITPTTEYTREKVKTGRRPGDLAARILNAGIRRQVTSFKGFRDTVGFSGDLGQYILSCDTGTTSQPMPVYIYNLTATINSGAAPSPMLRLIGNNTSSFYWTLQNGQSSGGGSSTLLQTKWRYGNTAPTFTRAVHDWSRIRLNLYGAKNRPIAVRVRLVQCLDDQCQPEQIQSGGVSVANNNNFWLNYLKPLMSNPIAANNAVPEKKCFKILETRVYNFQPTLTIENDTDAAIRTVDWFYRSGKIVDFQQGGGLTYSVGNLMDPTKNDLQPPTAYVSTRPPNVKQNIYVLIDGQVKNGQGVAPTDANVNASFDLNIETCYKYLEAN